MSDQERMTEIARRLEGVYPEGECALEAGGDPFRLLVMAILSAQCTDKRVNEVAPGLFRRYPDAPAFAAARQEDLENEIRTCGLYRMKAGHLIACAERIVRVYGGRVPSAMEDLLSLSGVGRKVANLIRGDVFGLGGIVADTHCIRIAGRLGFSDGKDPLRTERDLEKLVPVDRQSAFCHRLVRYGRDVCAARRPDCAGCVLRDLCPSAEDALKGLKQ
ncbi:MAG: endonuclease III [Clostridia bacterium]|nr:endonuclease III [Clostridia bacterium]